ncbi:MAG: DUF1488 family protein [Gemmataceae bacterium]
MIITFLPVAAAESLKRDAIVCYAVVDGREVPCEVSKETLIAKHEYDPESGTSLLDGFEAKRGDIEGIIRNEINWRGNYPFGRITYAFGSVRFSA